MKPAHRHTCAFQDDAPGTFPHGPLNKQHLFPKRMRRLFPELPDARTETSTYKRAASAFPTPATLSYDMPLGTLFTMEIKCVCELCNNGWMRKLEERAFPTLKRLIAGETLTLNLKNQRDVASWVTEVAMVGDYLLDDPIIPQASRSAFKSTRTPPSGWTIFLGNYGGSFFNCSALQQKGRLPEVVTDGQDTLFWIGRMYCRAQFYSHPPVDPPQFPNKPELPIRQIWPIALPQLHWPSPAMSDAVAQFIIDAHRKKHRMEEHTPFGWSGYPAA